MLKIDRHFVEPIDSSPPEATIVRAIIEMAHGLGLSVIAGGVGRQGQLDILSEYGCDEFQGFLRASTLAPEAAAALVTARNG